MCYHKKTDFHGHGLRCWHVLLGRAVHCFDFVLDGRLCVYDALAKRNGPDCYYYDWSRSMQHITRLPADCAREFFWSVIPLDGKLRSIIRDLMQLCRWCCWPKTSDCKRIVLYAERETKVFWLFPLHVFHGISDGWAVHWVQSFQRLDSPSWQVRKNSIVGIVENSSIKIWHVFNNLSDLPHFSIVL